VEKDYLEECLAAGMSLKQIAAEAGCAAGTVGYYVRKHGLLALGSDKFNPTSKLRKEDVQPLIEQGWTLKMMADHLGVAPTTVRNAIVRDGLRPTAAMERARSIAEARAQGLEEITLTCGRHGSTAFKITTTTARCRKCNSAGVANRRRRVKAMLVEEAGGACLICGYDRDMRALEFHHLDPSSKEFSVTSKGVTLGIAMLRAEAQKCVLLCSNCHAEVESGTTQLPATIVGRRRAA
jgi:hypothetical protein